MPFKERLQILPIYLLLHSTQISLWMWAVTSSLPSGAIAALEGWFVESGSHGRHGVIIRTLVLFSKSAHLKK